MSAQNRDRTPVYESCTRERQERNSKVEGGKGRGGRAVLGPRGEARGRRIYNSGDEARGARLGPGSRGRHALPPDGTRSLWSSRALRRGGDLRLARSGSGKTHPKRDHRAGLRGPSSGRRPRVEDALFRATSSGATTSQRTRAPEARLAQLELLRVVAERAEAHAQHLGRLHLHAASPFERQRHVVAVHLFALRLQVESLGQIGRLQRE